MWSPSRSASVSRLSTTTAAPSPNMLPLRLRVEGAHVAVGRLHAAGPEEVADPVGHPDRDAAGQRQLALAVAQALQARWTATSEVEQKVCTATLGPVQVEQVGRPWWSARPCRCP